MKRGILIFAVLTLFIFANLSFASAYFNLTTPGNLKKDYAPFEILSGKVNLSISEVAINSPIIFRIYENGEVISEKALSLKEMLFNKTYFCSPGDCMNIYSYDPSSANYEKTLYIEEGQEKIFGFIIQKEDKINNVYSSSFTINTNFARGYQVPLILNFFDELKYMAAFPTETFSQTRNFGCYDPVAQKQASNRLSRDSSYCEKIILPETNALSLGALTRGTDTKKITMSIRNKTREMASCVYSPLETDSCIVREMNLKRGEYYICVSSASTSGFYVFSESGGRRCGYTGFNFTKESASDYAVFARAAEYSELYENFVICDGDYCLDPLGKINTLNAKIKNYLLKKYANNCKNGCVIPIKIKGVNQDLRISDVMIDFDTIAGESDSTSDIFDIEEIPATLNFSGYLELSQLELDTGEKGKKTFTIDLNDETVFSQDINVLPAPIINGVYPRTVPAGTPATLVADVELSGGKNITSYVWEFGDGKSETTSVNHVTHTYMDLKEYILKLTVKDRGNFSSSKEFSIIAGSPKIVVGDILKKKKDDITKIEQKIAAFEDPYKALLTKILQIEEAKFEIKKIEDQLNTSTTDEEFLSVARQLDGIDIPYNIVTETDSGPFVEESSQIDPSLLTEAGNYDENLTAQYQDSIISWQLKNIGLSFLSKKVYALNYDGSKNFLLYIISLTLNSQFDGESYLIINPSENILIKSESGLNLHDTGGSLHGVIEKNSQANAEIYISAENTTSIERPTIFVSPRFSELVLSSELSATCNYNKKCEPDFGEDSKNCPNDCKPWKRILFWILAVLLLGFIIYSSAAVWYKLHYEKYLFKDRRNLFNLMAFMENAKNKGVSVQQIFEGLKKKGWSSEQVVYALKKLERKRTGMFELIPFSRLFDIKVKKPKKEKINKPAKK